MLLRCCIALCTILLQGRASLVGSSWWQGETVDQKYGLSQRLDQELWRDGHPDSGFCVELLRESIATGDKNYVSLVANKMIELIRRRYIEAERFADVLADLRSFELATGRP